MDFVNDCPRNLAEIAEASTRLGCLNDTYGNNQYICVPNVILTSLVEFCYDGIMGIHDKNHCVAASEKSLLGVSCISFSSGCPQDYHWSWEFYKYPACQNINTQHHCYVQDPSCPHNVPVEDNDNHDTFNPKLAIFVVIFSLISFVCMVFSVIYWRKKSSGESPKVIKRDDKRITESPKKIKRVDKRNTDRVSNSISSVESLFSKKKDNEHSDEHDCDSNVVHKEQEMTEFTFSYENS